MHYTCSSQYKATVYSSFTLSCDIHAVFSTKILYSYIVYFDMHYTYSSQYKLLYGYTLTCVIVLSTKLLHSYTLTCAILSTRCKVSYSYTVGNCQPRVRPNMAWHDSQPPMHTHHSFPYFGPVGTWHCPSTHDTNLVLYIRLYACIQGRQYKHYVM